MKVALLASVFFLGAVPAVAHAADVDWTVSSGYVFERQAFVASTSAVANVSATFEHGNCLSSNLWGQVGDQASTEFDATATCSGKLGNVDVRATVGGYFYPAGGSKPIYTIAAGATVPVGQVSFDLDAQRYEGALESTLVSVSASATLRISESFQPRVTFGRAHNEPEGTSPWFARASVPLWQSDNAPTIGVRGFWGDGDGVVFDLVGTF